MYFSNTPFLNENSYLSLACSDDDPIYQFCEACINEYAETGDEGYLEYLLEGPDWGEGPVQGPIEGMKDLAWGIKHHMTTKNIGLRAKNIVKRNPVKVGAALYPLGAPLQLYGEYKGIQRIYKHFKNKPRSVIAKKIASLRKLYATWLHRAKIERDDKTSSIIKRVCTNIMLLIDKLLELLQRGSDKLAGH